MKKIVVLLIISFILLQFPTAIGVLAGEAIAWMDIMGVVNDDVYLRDVAHNGSMFVAVGEKGTIVSSTDRGTWTHMEAYLSTDVCLESVVWGGDKFVAVGYESFWGDDGSVNHYGVILTSPDGITWTRRHVDTTIIFDGVAWGDNRYVAIGYSSESHGYAVLTSSDGIYWAERVLQDSISLNAVTWGKDQYVAVGEKGLILTSPDGINWTQRMSGLEGKDWSYLTDVIWANNQYVAVGYEASLEGASLEYGSVILTSPDGLTWTQRQSTGEYPLRAIAWGGDRYVAVGFDWGVDGSIILTSPNGIQWNSISYNTENNPKLFSIAAKDDRFVAVGNIISVSKSDPVEMFTKIAAFVTRFYNTCLNRQPDDEGLSFWVNVLAQRLITGAQTAENFLLSSEFMGKNLTDAEFIDIMYRAFFDREPDGEGCEFWQNMLNMGYSRRYILAGFVNSKEFSGLCEAAGIMPGNIVITEEDEPDPAVVYTHIADFVTRFYHICLGREPDNEGLNHWVRGLARGQITGAGTAESFIFSHEFVNKNLTDAEFIDIMYRAFFDREPDDEGRHFWQNVLNIGYSRRYVMAGFVNSQEFARLCNDAGITPGVIIMTEEDEAHRNIDHSK